MRYLTNIVFAIALLIPTFVSAGPLVNINTADTHELVTDLTGVTEEVAQLIIEHREKNGPYTSLEDVLDVEGVGRDFLNINRDYMHLGEDPRLEEVNS